ncbi:MAG: helix-turn-helix domain-containing protein [Pseudonocardiaceae bacterium]
MSEHAREEGSVDEARAFGRRLREVRCWRELTLREAAGLAGLSFSFWGQVERGEKAVTNRNTLAAMASALRVHPTELTGQPWTSRDAAGAEAHTGLESIQIALERYELGLDSGVPVRAWPQIHADVDPLVRLHHHVVDYAATAALASALIGELQAAYLRLPQQRREILLRLMDVQRVTMRTTKDLGDRGLPMVAVRAVQQCAEALDDPVWLGCATVVRGWATGELDRVGQYRRSVAAAETLTGKLSSGDALQTCGMLHLMAALATGARGDRDTSATHLDEASALAARMDTEVGIWARLFFGPTAVGIHRTSLALEFGEHGQALEAAKAVHPELLPERQQAFFWIEVGRALVAGKKTRHKGVHVLLHAEHLAPQRIHTDVIVRETVAGLLRQARRDAGGRELRGLAWRMGIAPRG